MSRSAVATGRAWATGVRRVLPGGSHHHLPMGWAIRAGFHARALTYALIGAVAVALGVGAASDGTAPDQQAALGLVTRAPLGKVALVGAAVGLGAYALWKLSLAITGLGHEGAREHRAFDRTANAGGAIVYAGFCVLTFEVAAGRAGDQAREQHETTVRVLHWPAGAPIVAAAALGLIAISLYQGWVAVSGGFTRNNKTDEMSVREHHAFMWCGRVGLFVRALVFGVSGYFLLLSALAGRVSRGIGIDGALAEVHGVPLGDVLLCMIGVGMFAFAAYSVIEGRRRRL